MTARAWRASGPGAVHPSARQEILQRPDFPRRFLSGGVEDELPSVRMHREILEVLPIESEAGPLGIPNSINTERLSGNHFGPPQKQHRDTENATRGGRGTVRSSPVFRDRMTRSLMDAAVTRVVLLSDQSRNE